MAIDPILEGALALSDQGFRVHPLHSIRPDGSCTCNRPDCPTPGKHPRLGGWQKLPHADHAKILEWWKKYPNSNVGIITGQGLLVLDVDTNGKSGAKSLAELEQINGPLPPTRRAITGSGGYHYYFFLPPGIEIGNSVQKIAPGIDIRCERGQVVAPPSMHASGNRYRWDDTAPSYLVEATEWLISAAKKAEKKPTEKHEAAPTPATTAIGIYVQAALKKACETVARAAEGGRNDTLNQEAHSIGTLIGAGVLQWREAESALFDAARTCGLGESESEKTIRSGLTAGSLKPRDLSQIGQKETRRHQEPPPDEDIPFPGDDEAPGEKKEKIGTGEKKEKIDGTDLASARLFCELHGENIHWIQHWGRWYGWNGQIWESDEVGKVRQLAEDVVTELEERARVAWQDLQAAKADKDKERVTVLEKVYGAAAKWRTRVANHAGFQAMLEMTKHQPGISLKTDDIDCDPMLISVDNGTVDLRTGKLIQPKREDLITKHIPLLYRQDIPCPTWEKFIDTIMGGNQGLVSYLQRAIGYSLTGHTIEQVCFFCHGKGANGKGTMFETLMKIMGDYAKPVESDLLMATSGDRHPTDIANLLGARLVTTTETDEHRRFAEAKLKWLTGGDKLSARFMREDHFEFTPTHKIWIAGNHKPSVRGTDHAIWRRIHLIPFNHIFEKPDTTFPGLLIPELPGILAWAVRGCLEWQRIGLAPPVEVLEATAEYRKSQDVLAHFIEDRCNVAKSLRVAFSDLYKSYKEWTEECGEFTESSKSFGQRLTERGFEQEVGTGGKKYRRGIGLLTTTDNDVFWG